MQYGQLIIKPISAQLVRDTDFFTKMDPYCVISVGQQRFSTQVCRNGGKNPYWQEQYTARKESQADIIKFEVWDYDSTSRNDYVGEGSLAVTQIYNNRYSGNVQLTYKGQQNAGVLMVDITFMPDQNQGYPQQAGYPPQQPGYPPQQPGYPPQQPGYPPPGYPPYPPQQPGYPPQPYPQQLPPPYPPQQTPPYPPQQPGYPTPPYPPQGVYPPPPPMYPQQTQPGYPQNVQVIPQGQHNPYGQGHGTNVKIFYRPTCYQCQGSGFYMKKGHRKQCKECCVAMGICKKCYGTGYNIKKGKPCKNCRKY